MRGWGQGGAQTPGFSEMGARGFSPKTPDAASWGSLGPAHQAGDPASIEWVEPLPAIGEIHREGGRASTTLSPGGWGFWVSGDRANIPQ